jgi:hypothetical protein
LSPRKVCLHPCSICSELNSSIQVLSLLDPSAMGWLTKQNCIDVSHPGPGPWQQGRSAQHRRCSRECRWRFCSGKYPLPTEIFVQLYFSMKRRTKCSLNASLLSATESQIGVGKFRTHCRKRIFRGAIRHCHSVLHSCFACSELNSPN